MVDISTRDPQSSPPDRRLLAQLTKDPKLIRYLEQLSTDAATIGPDNFAVLLELIVNAAELANSAQGSANNDRQAIAELGLAILALENPGAAIQRLGAALEDLAGIAQSPDLEIQRLLRKVDELENLLVEIRPPIFPLATPPFAPAVVTVTGAYSVLAAPSYQPMTVRASAATAAFTVTLPAAPGLLQLVNIKKIDATANAVTVSGGAITIDGALTRAIGSQYTNLQVQYNGATWDVL